jgi:hypothetical protein
MSSQAYRVLTCPPEVVNYIKQGRSHSQEDTDSAKAGKATRLQVGWGINSPKVTAVQAVAPPLITRDAAAGKSNASQIRSPTSNSAQSSLIHHSLFFTSLLPYSLS